jgi:hypothetical protein
MIEVTVFVDGRQDLTHPSYLFAGLAMLARAGEIEVRFERLSASKRPRLQPGNVFSQVEVRSNGRTFSALFDFKDQNDVYCDELLHEVDFYFKRSYVPAEVEKRSAKNVHPLGMPFACRHPGELGAVIADSMASRRPEERWPERFGRLKRYLGIDYARSFTPGADKVRRVIFQTRLWEKHEVADDDLDAVNLPRVSLVRRLRQELGSRFLGGLVPTPRATRDFPELVRYDGVRRHEYLELMRTSAVGISTRGLFHSTPWKLSEYLATGVAVVTQPLTNRPLDPLVEGEHALVFDSEDECLRQCTRLLEDPPEAERLQKAARAYYERSVEPMATVRRHLRLVVG